MIQQVVASAGELVRDGLDGDDLVARAAFAFMPPPDPRAEAWREVGGVDPGPRQVAIAAFSIAVARVPSEQSPGQRFPTATVG